MPLPTTLAAARAARAREALGVDVACIEDVQPTFALAEAVPNLAMALCRRLITPRGGLFYAPDYGLDLREYLNAGVTESEMATLPDQIRLELEKDERVQSAVVRLAFNRPAMTMKVGVVVSTSIGPFRLVVSISQLTIDLLGPQDVTIRAVA